MHSFIHSFILKSSEAPVVSQALSVDHGYIMDTITAPMKFTINLGIKAVLTLVFPGEDPEARRLRTVKNIADLRQNLEETMSSLRGTQVTHRYLKCELFY